MIPAQIGPLSVLAGSAITAEPTQFAIELLMEHEDLRENSTGSIEQGLFREKPMSPFQEKTPDDPSAENIEDICDFVRELWFAFRSGLEASEAVNPNGEMITEWSLKSQIDLFREIAPIAMAKRFPFLEGNVAQILLAICIGVARSHTHTKEDVEEAMGFELPI